MAVTYKKITTVDEISQQSAGATIFVNDSGALRQAKVGLFANGTGGTDPQALHFKGVLAALPADNAGYVNADFIIVGQKEYVFYNDDWYELGDATNVDLTDLNQRVEDLENMSVQQALVIKDAAGNELVSYDGADAKELVLPEMQPELVVVKITYNDADGYVADKTFAEMAAAYEAGYPIAASSNDGAMVPVLAYVKDGIIMFGLDTMNDAILIQMYADDTVSVNQGNLNHALIIKTPGQTYEYDCGQEVEVDLTNLGGNTAPFVVTLTGDIDGGFTADKTFAEAQAAHLAGTQVVFDMNGVQFNTAAFREDNFFYFQWDSADGLIIGELNHNDIVTVSQDVPGKLTINTPGGRVVYTTRSDQEVDLSQLAGGTIDIEPYVVTFETADSAFTTSSVFTADKTFAEVEAVRAAGRQIVVCVIVGGVPMYFPQTAYVPDTAMQVHLSITDGEFCTLTWTSDDSIVVTTDAVTVHAANVLDGAPTQQLVTDLDGNAQWEDRIAYKYESVGAEVVHSNTETIAVDPDEQMGVITTPWLTDIVPGEELTVTFDGVEYTCTAIDYTAYEADMPAGTIFAGNQGAIGGEDNGLPFAVVAVTNEGASEPDIGCYGLIGAFNGGTSCSIAIKGKMVTKTIKTIDPDLLPESAKHQVITLTMDGGSVYADTGFETVWAKDAAELKASIVINSPGYAVGDFAAARSCTVTSVEKFNNPDGSWRQIQIRYNAIIGDISDMQHIASEKMLHWTNIGGQAAIAIDNTVSPQARFVRSDSIESNSYMRITYSSRPTMEPVTVEQMKKDLGIHVSDTEPVDAPVGALWVDTSV